MTRELIHNAVAFTLGLAGLADVALAGFYLQGLAGYLIGGAGAVGLIVACLALRDRRPR